MKKTSLHFGFNLCPFVHSKSVSIDLLLPFNLGDRAEIDNQPKVFSAISLSSVVDFIMLRFSVPKVGMARVWAYEEEGNRRCYYGSNSDK